MLTSRASSSNVLTEGFTQTATTYSSEERIDATISEFVDGKLLNATINYFKTIYETKSDFYNILVNERPFDGRIFFKDLNIESPEDKSNQDSPLKVALRDLNAVIEEALNTNYSNVISYITNQIENKLSLSTATNIIILRESLFKTIKTELAKADFFVKITAAMSPENGEKLMIMLANAFLFKLNSTAYVNISDKDQKEKWSLILAIAKSPLTAIEAMQQEILTTLQKALEPFDSQMLLEYIKNKNINNTLEAVSSFYSNIEKVKTNPKFSRLPNGGQALKDKIEVYVKAVKDEYLTTANQNPFYQLGNLIPLSVQLANEFEKRDFENADKTLKCLEKSILTIKGILKKYSLSEKGHNAYITTFNGISAYVLSTHPTPLPKPSSSKKGKKEKPEKKPEDIFVKEFKQVIKKFIEQAPAPKKNSTPKKSKADSAKAKIELGTPKTQPILATIKRSKSTSDLTRGSVKPRAPLSERSSDDSISPSGSHFMHRLFTGRSSPRLPTTSPRKASDQKPPSNR